ncbi:hypothetical protein JR334_00925 [Clostridia bacterium]|nr:hypothetical protein JR334_00925 [Clostridia bacterium]
MKYFKKEKVYPNEAFIQEAIENYFSNEGFEIQKDGQIDLIAEKNDEKWIIEAKGMTSQITVDFNTCIGQLVKNMESSTWNYAIAIPYEDKYKVQCMKLPDYFRNNNNLYIIIVNENAQIKVITPTNNVEDTWK